MPPHGQNGWEPDPRKLGNWRSLFEDPRSGASPGQPLPPPQGPEADDAAAIDIAEYRPWIMQRARDRPSLMLHLRRYEPKSRLWTGWMLPYPNLYAVEYLGDRMLSLDFGVRQFVVEGHGLDGLVGPLQQGAIQAMVEYSPGVWPACTAGPVISTIRRVSPSDPSAHG